MPRTNLTRSHHRESQTPRHWLEDQPDPITEPLATQRLNAGATRKTPTQQPARHCLAVRMIDKTKPFEIGPVVDFRLRGGHDQRQRFLGEMTRNLSVVLFIARRG